MELSLLSNRVANVLRQLGVRKGDRVFIFLPRRPELHLTFLGALKTGAVAGTLFAAFGPKAILDRLQNAGAKVLITTPELKKRVDEVKNQLPDLEHFLLVDRPPRELLEVVDKPVSKRKKIYFKKPFLKLYWQWPTKRKSPE
jgi:acetyl-CoA synthetase